ncbi:MAG: Dna-J like membrane chaperone protein [Deltaproteobacteria bacterium ADurb.Bin510]|nr:MAG: Dna-J like membrane chaperone protein [Deltaproteobacteria bacterium ADurb.Bin510]
MQLSLEDVSFALILKQLIEESFDGIIFAVNAETRKGLIFKEGRLCAVQSNRTDELLGSILISQGQISAEANEASLRRARIERRKQGEILLEQELISPAAIAEALNLQTEKRFGELFGWSQGFVKITPKPRIDKPHLFGSDEFKALVRRLILANCTSTVVIAALSPFAAAKPQPLSDDLPRDTGVNLMEILAQPVHQTLAVSEAGARALLALFCTGALNFEKNRYQDLIDSLSQMLASLENQDPFEVFGLSRHCSDDQLKRAYIKIAKEHHPDVYAYAQDAQVKHLSTEIFAHIQKAYEAVKRIREGKPAEDEVCFDNDEIRQELLFRQANEALRLRDYQKSLDLFRVLTKLSPDNRVYAEAFIKTLYLKWQASKRGSSLEIKLAIKDALTRFPESDQLYLLLGWVFKKEGSNKAIEAFRQAVRINPNNTEARRELRLIEMRGGLKNM